MDGKVITRIDSLPDRESLLKLVIDLSDENKKTLGFIPRGAFAKLAEEGQVIVALHNSLLAGYCIFRFCSRDRRLAISQICVKNEFRGDGYANLLLDHVKSLCRKNHYAGILIKTRKDYIYAPKIWSRNQFFPVSESEGRGKDKVTLVHWWWENQAAKDLFAAEEGDENRLCIVIDQNILISLNDNEESVEILSSDWISNEVDIAVAPESYEEILRHKELGRRIELRNFISNFSHLSYEDDQVVKFERRLSSLFPLPHSKQDKSDIKQLSYCAASRRELFITSDARLLDLSADIANEINVLACSPLSLFLQIDEKLQADKYRPNRLAGSTVVAKEVSSKELNDIYRIFLANTRGEKLVSFKKLVNSSLVYEGECGKFLAVKNEGDRLCALMGGKISDGILKINLLRIEDDELFTTIAYQILNYSSYYARDNNCASVVISDAYLPNIAQELKELGFVEIEGSYEKQLLSIVLDISSPLEPQLEDESPHTAALLSGVVEENSSILYKYTEKKLWPLKFKGTELPVYVVPIRPGWAKALFDTAMAELDLFGVNPLIAGNLTNVYYTASSATLAAPARILWYVSRDESIGLGGQIRAVSYLDEVATGLPKELFPRFKRLGVYEWRDIYALAKEDIGNQITALKFSFTELLESPVEYGEAQMLFEQLDIPFNNFVGPQKATDQFFFSVYG